MNVSAMANGDGLTQEQMDVIGGCIAQITAILIVGDRNFLQGNPAVFNVPTDVRDMEIRCVISLGGKGRPVPRIARING